MLEKEKIVIEIPQKFKKDLYNTKALDKESKDNFFDSENLFGEMTVGNKTLKNIEIRWNIALKRYRKLISKSFFSNFFNKKNRKEIIKLKEELYYLEKNYRKYYGEYEFYKKFDDFSFEFFNISIEEELKLYNSDFDKLNRDILVLRKRNEEKQENINVNKKYYLDFIFFNRLVKKIKNKIGFKKLHYFSFKNIITDSIFDLGEVKELLSDFRSDVLSLNGLKKINNEISLLINREDFHGLKLNGLSKIDNNLIELLNEFYGKKGDIEGGSILSLDGLKILSSDESILLFNLNVEYLSLNGLEKIDKNILNFNRILSLNGLKKIDINVVKQLKQINGDFSKLFLNCSKNININTAKELGCMKVESLVLNLINIKKVNILKEIITFKGGYLGLNGLTKINNQIFKQLKEVQTKWLGLNGLTKIKIIIAKWLTNINIERLELNGLKNININIISELKDFKGKWLYLNGLTEIEEGVAKELKEFKGGLSLNGLTEIEEGVAKELKELKGDLSLNGLKIIRKTDKITEQKQEIKDFVREYTHGSCLVSGYRGIGKTSTIKTAVDEVNKELEDEEIIKIIINIPEQKKNTKGEVESFGKDELITKIIREIYLALKREGFSGKELDYFEDQYIRTFSNVEEVKGYLKVAKRGWFKKFLIGASIYVFPLIILYQSGLFGLNYFFSDLYLVDLILNNKGDNYINNYLNIINIIDNNILLKTVFDIILYKIGDFLSILEILAGLFSLFISNFLGRLLFNVGFEGKLERLLYNEDIAEYKLSNNIGDFQRNESYFRLLIIDFKRFISKRIKLISNLFFPKKRKLVIVIDELDKLLDFEKESGKDKNSKATLDMKQIFDVLGKLKTLFFETTGAIFFVVTNKQAYDYYLTNKHQEDDIISNIFNKIVYIPGNSMDNFNLNVSVTTGIQDIKEEIVEDKENINETKEEKRVRIKKEEEKREQDRILREQIKKTFYFKSHGNWRKSKFELSNIIKGCKIILDKEQFDFEYKFYDFFDKLYQAFDKDSLKNIDEKIFVDFLFSMSKDNNGYVDKLYLETVPSESVIIKKRYLEKLNFSEKYISEYIKIINDSKISLKYLQNELNGKESKIEIEKRLKKSRYYKIYLLKIDELINIKKKECFGELAEDKDLFISEYLEHLLGDFCKEDFSKRKFFGYFVASIEKVSQEYAYRDYIMNSLLNIYENIKFLRKTTLDEILKNIKINEDDLEYPAFMDLMLYWLPLMLIYFSNINPDD